MTTRTLGPMPAPVSALGLGCMGMSDFYGPADEAESTATLHAALEAGITLLDTGDFYGMGHNELLIGHAIKGHKRDNAVLSVKFGVQRSPDYGFHGMDCSPRRVKNDCAYSLKRLGVDYIDIYRPSRVDAAVPIEDTIGAIADLVQAGYVRHIGISELGVENIRKAASVAPIVDMQIEYSLLSRGIEASILPTLRELNIGVTAYGVLSRGLIANPQQQYNPRDFRAHLPRFQGENLEQNTRLVATIAALAEQKSCTVVQLAIAWVLAQGPDVVPLVGARRRDRLAEALGALNVTLTPSDLAQLNAALPVGATAGNRYPDALMQHLDSER